MLDVPEDLVLPEEAFLLLLVEDFLLLEAVDFFVEDVEFVLVLSETAVVVSVVFVVSELFMLF